MGKLPETNFLHLVQRSSSPWPTFSDPRHHLLVPILAHAGSITLTSHTFLDLTAKKEQIMNSVRQELALANAQELMNVRYPTPHLLLSTTHPLLSFRKQMTAAS